MPVISKSQKEPLGRVTEQNIMTACRKLHQYNNIMKIVLEKKEKEKKKPDKTYPKKPKFNVNNSASTSCKKIPLANDIYNVL